MSGIGCPYLPVFNHFSRVVRITYGQPPVLHSSHFLPVFSAICSKRRMMTPTPSQPNPERARTRKIAAAKVTWPLPPAKSTRGTITASTKQTMPTPRNAPAIWELESLFSAACEPSSPFLKTDPNCSHSFPFSAQTKDSVISSPREYFINKSCLEKGPSVFPSFVAT